MKKLITCYQEIKDELEKRINSATDTNQIVQILQNEVRRLSDVSGEYIENLTSPQARIALEMLDMLQECCGALMVVRIQELRLDGPVSGEQSKNKGKHKTKVTREFLSSVTGSTLAGVVTRGFGGGVVGAAIGTGVGIIFSKTRKKPDAESFQNPVINLEVDVSALLSKFYQALDTIDRAVIAQGELFKQTTPKPSLENYQELLKFFQDLMGESSDEQDQLPLFTRKRLEQIPMILKHYGIETKVYQHNGESTSVLNAQSMFDFEPSLNPEHIEYVTLKPAFIKGEQVLLRGQVIEPASSTPQQSKKEK
jgi:hypothetical protein